MKKMISLAIAAIGLAAFGEYGKIELKDKMPFPADAGKAVAVNVASTDADANVKVYGTREIASYTNGITIISEMVTNTITYVTNGIWCSSNLIHTVSTTNIVPVLKARYVLTNEIADVTCTDGYASVALTNDCYLIGGDSIVTTGLNVDGESVKASLIIVK